MKILTSLVDRAPTLCKHGVSVLRDGLGWTCGCAP